MNNYSYAWEKLYKGIRSLTLGLGDLRSRLVEAHLAFHTLTPNDFPESLKKDWEWIEAQLDKKPPLELPDGRIYRGSVEETCRAMKNKTAFKIAQRILLLFEEVERMKR